ncbi:hypothetical protein G7092_06155 [Mucilaginibacter sp. HC2]|uniref:hypothetical protein n=1 Tax=Mucilaginibacter inviolabilis TaxID=2714892 RepID=UPI00140B6E0B|nr:hypothetical protein [Mucilaginibacter inviolabilis]NHA03366.1 hypothetical protein [Mucilaginibacter inviolabilis]
MVFYCEFSGRYFDPPADACQPGCDNRAPKRTLQWLPVPDPVTGPAPGDSARFNLIRTNISVKDHLKNDPGH